MTKMHDNSPNTPEKNNDHSHGFPEDVVLRAGRPLTPEEAARERDALFKELDQAYKELDTEGTPSNSDG